MRQLPYKLIPHGIDNLKIPEYPVKVFRSEAVVEFRSLNQCVAVDAEMDLIFNTATVASDPCPNIRDELLVAIAWKFYHQGFGVLSSFEIPKDHPLWEFLSKANPTFQDLLITPYWRFRQQPDWVIDDVKDIWNFRIPLLNVSS